MTRPDTITLAGVELRGEDLTGKYCSRDERITAWSKRQPGGDTFWFASVFGDPVMGRDLEALDAAVRAAIAEIFRSLVPLVPAEVEAIRAEERERCAAVVRQPHDETRTLWSTHVAVTHERDEMAARIRALGPVQP